MVGGGRNRPGPGRCSSHDVASSTCPNDGEPGAGADGNLRLPEACDVALDVRCLRSDSVVARGQHRHASGRVSTRRRPRQRRRSRAQGAGPGPAGPRTASCRRGAARSRLPTGGGESEARAWPQEQRWHQRSGHSAICDSSEDRCGAARGEAAPAALHGSDRARRRHDQRTDRYAGRRYSSRPGAV